MKFVTITFTAPIFGALWGQISYEIRKGRPAVGRPSPGQCCLQPRDGRLLHQSLASVCHEGGDSGGQGPHIKGGGGATLATFDGLRAGVGSLPLEVGG